MIIGIDASNLRSGGAITHLSELLLEADPVRDNFIQIIVWGEKLLLDKIKNHSWLVKIHEPLLDQSLLHRLFWQRFKVSGLAKKLNCDVLFIPSGIILGNFHPVATMSHNLLPFEWREIQRYGISWQMVRNLLLRRIQSFSFKNADGVIFLSRYAEKTIMNIIKKSRAMTAIIPHGVNKEFSRDPRPQLSIKEYSLENPYRILYVSTIDMYKHQWNVARATEWLRVNNYPVTLNLIGSAYSPALTKLEETLGEIDPIQEYIKYLGPVAYEEIAKQYALSDLCVFASSCENMPNILLEGMASGLPIACSKFGPMSEVLGDAGVYFNPEDPQNIAKALRLFIDSEALRSEKAKLSFARSKNYSWKGCASETFNFLVDIARTKN